MLKSLFILYIIINNKILREKARWKDVQGKTNHAYKIHVVHISFTNIHIYF